MGSRYYITGVQLGIIEFFIEKNPKQVLELLKEIEDKQYLCEKEQLNKLNFGDSNGND